MSTLPVGLLIESLVALLLVVTIGYCVVLNKRLKRLRADEEALRATISELITASEIAERAILGLKATAGEADRTLGQRLVDAERLSQELAAHVSRGNTVLERITQITEAARTVQQNAAAPAPVAAAPIAEPAPVLPPCAPAISVRPPWKRPPAWSCSASVPRSRPRDKSAPDPRSRPCSQRASGAEAAWARSRWRNLRHRRRERGDGAASGRHGGRSHRCSFRRPGTGPDAGS